MNVLTFTWRFFLVCLMCKCRNSRVDRLQIYSSFFSYNKEVETKRLPMQSTFASVIHKINNAQVTNHQSKSELTEIRGKISCKCFQSILSDKRFSNLVPPRHKVSHNLRHSRTFSLPRFRTDRYQRSFIPAMSKYMNS